MKNSIFLLSALAGVLMFTSCSENKTSETTVTDSDSVAMNNDAKMSEEKGVMVGGANMVPSKNIVENAVNSTDHTSLVGAVKHASLVETLSGPGPFTVFAPTNAAFGALPAGTVDKLSLIHI